MRLDPVEQPPHLDVRTVTVRLRDPLHRIEQLLFALTDHRGRRRAVTTLCLGRVGECLYRRILLCRELVVGQRRAIVVGVGRVQQVGADRRQQIARVAGSVGPLALAGRGSHPLTLQRRAMHSERTRERLDRREQSLLQSDHEQPRGGTRPLRQVGVTLLAGATVLVEKPAQDELGGVFGEAVDGQPLDAPSGKAALHAAQILLETTDHAMIR